MSARPAPITTAAHGSTRCVGCSKKFDATPGVPVTVVECDVQGWSGVDSAGQFRRSLSTHRVGRRWHTPCLDDFHAQAEAYRAQVAADRDELVAKLQAVADQKHHPECTDPWAGAHSPCPTRNAPPDTTD